MSFFTSCMKFYEASEKNGDKPDKFKFREGSKPGDSTTLHAIEQLFMALVLLRTETIGVAK